MRTFLVLSSAVLAACGPGETVPVPDAAWPVSIESPPRPRVEYERVVLVTIDTLRADHVSSYGYARKTTPFLDRLAGQGALFTRAMASVSQTAPSHATMLTGVAPAVHRVLANGGQLEPEAVDLATLFAAAGFETAAFLNVKFLSGIAAPFGKVVVRAVGKEGGKPRVLHGEHVVQATLEWLAGERTRERFFLWVHLYDPHHWKEAVKETTATVSSMWREGTPPGFLEYVAELHGLPEPVPGEPYDLGWRPESEHFGEIRTDTPEGYLHYIDAYDSLVLYSDQQIERLYRGLEELGLRGRTLWIVTSDHGEGLASHGIAGHGSRIYQEQLAVPLIVHASDGSLAPRRIDALVGHVDLLATLAETLGARVSGDGELYEGRSLWPLIRGETGGWTPRTIFAQRRPPESAGDPDQSAMSALQTGQHKYILHEPGEDEFYELMSDPRELRNAAGGGGAAEEELRRALEERLRAFRSRGPSTAPGEIPEEWAQELRDLGYAR